MDSNQLIQQLVEAENKAEELIRHARERKYNYNSNI